MAIGLSHDDATKVLEFQNNVDGLTYPTQPNAVVWHDQNSTQAKRDSLITLLQIPIKYLKWVSNDVSEMTGPEKTAVDVAEAAAIIAGAKAAAKAFQDALDAQGRLMRTIVKLVVDEINTLRKRDRDRSVDVAAATSLADLKTRWAAESSLADRTYAQAKTAIEVLVDGE